MTHTMRRRPAQIASLLLAALLLLLLCSGCTANTVSIASATNDTALAPSITTAVYSYRDENRVDIYLTDIPPAVLEAALFPAQTTPPPPPPLPPTNDPTAPITNTPTDTPTEADPFQPSATFQGTPATRTSRRFRPGPPVGQITHIRMFVRPYAGRTPIDPTAANATIRHAVLAGDERGVYVGGAFCLPRSRASSRTFRADVRGGSLALATATPGFNDLLGTARVSAEVRATLNERLARLLENALENAAQPSR